MLAAFGVFLFSLRPFTISAKAPLPYRIPDEATALSPTRVDATPVTIVIKSEGNTLAFDKKEITVKTGQEVRLVFKNEATVTGMLHNVVILTNEAAIDRVGMAAIQAAQSEYIPEDDAILFHTPLADAGETVEVTFIAPTPGQYAYTCTFPGHYVLMRGVLNVTSGS